MILADSSLLIAAVRSDDELHERATELLRETSDTLLVTDHILDEVITFLNRRDGPAIALPFAERVLQSERFEVAYAGPSRTVQTLYILRRSPGLSFCDALSVAVMQERGVHRILSFDSDFDKIKGLVRIH